MLVRISAQLIVPFFSLLIALSCSNHNNCNDATNAANSGHCEQHTIDSLSLKTAENQHLMDDVMQVHDEMMPRMSQINQLQQKMLEMAKSTKNAKQKEQFLAVAKELSEAENAMFAWMEQFPSNLDSLPAPKIKTILEIQKSSVLRMREQMQNALKKSDDLIVNMKSSDI